jgi:CRP-like cAMP-binding protein
MAAMLGVRLESLSRIIAELKRENILRPLGKDVYEYDVMALSQYVKD